MILVTGATGLLGSHLLVELSKTNQSIRALYRRSEGIKKVEQLFQFYFPASFSEKLASIEWFSCDIEDVCAVEDAMENISVVYHCAALVSFRRRDYGKMVRVNRRGTENLVNLSLEKKVSHFCYVSSTAAVGKPDNTANLIVKETNKWEENEQTSGYALSKHLAEKEVWRGIEEGLNAVIVNPSVILGAGDWDESSLTIFRTVNHNLKFYTPGANAVVDARDVANIMVELVNKSIFNERFLLIGENLSFLNLLGKIARRLGKKTPSFSTPRFFAEVAWRAASLFALFTRKAPTLTKETVNSAYSTTRYDSDKIKSALNCTFFTADEAIDNTVKFHEFKKSNN
jgi:nucleoside-diphosphate-sugar epimerase